MRQYRAISSFIESDLRGRSRRRLPGCPEGGHLGEELGRQDSALHPEGREPAPVPRARHRQTLAIGRKT